MFIKNYKEYKDILELIAKDEGCEYCYNKAVWTTAPWMCEFCGTVYKPLKIIC